MTKPDVRDKPWTLQVCAPRSVLVAATFVAFLSGIGDEPARAESATPKPGTHPNTRTATAPHALNAHKAHHPAKTSKKKARHAAPVQAQVALASWYGHNQAGQMTASGELFDPSRLTAAHRTLPLGTRIRVTRVSTGDSVLVTVNDRGPYVRGRVIDLSPAAAHALKTRADETLPVRIDVVSLPQLPVRTAKR
jgi:rare lipoprotein A (peptidoglycan hydrolase)